MFNKDLQLFFDSAPDATVIVNQNGLIEAVNTQIERIFGYTKEELLGKKVEMLIPGEFHTKHEHHRTQYFRKPNVRPMGVGLELFGLHKDGTKFPVEISLSPISTDEGTLVSAAIRNITARKKIEHDLLTLNKKLEESNKELESFSYSISHDLRAPLRHIIGFGEKLSKRYGEKLDDEGKRVLNKITSSASKMSELIDELLEFSRIGRMEIGKNRVNLDDLIKEIRDEFSVETNFRKIKWEIEKLPEVYGDKMLLKLVVQNLISNSIKYTKNREIAEIKISFQNGTDKEYLFSISDNGVGFDNKYSGNLFGVFKRLHSSDQFEGTGIGLAIVKRIIQRHGGRVWAEGIPDKGASFFFTLPEI